MIPGRAWIQKKKIASSNVILQGGGGGGVVKLESKIKLKEISFILRKKIRGR